jgi:hypothetical protein
VAQQPHGDRWRDERVAVVGRAYRLDEQGRAGVLEDEADRAAP